MANWYEVPKLNVPLIVREQGGVKIRVHVSPYDVPTAARGRVEGQRFHIDLKYLNSEPMETRQTGELMLTVGKRSQRIYSIALDVRKFPGDQIGLELAIQNEVDSGLKGLGAPTGNMKAVHATLSSTPAIYSEIVGSR